MFTPSPVCGPGGRTFEGGLILCPLFGTTNQLVSGVTLLVVSVWLKRQGKTHLYTLVPMLLVAAATIAAMSGELISYFRDFEARWLVALMGTVILAADIWVLIEGGRVLMGIPDRSAT